MSSKHSLGDLCTFARGASTPRARMYENGDYLYIHYGDLYKGFDTSIDVESPQKPIPYITKDEKIRPSQELRDQDIVYVLTSETIDDLGHAYLFNNPRNLPAVAGTETTIMRVKDQGLILPPYLNYLAQTPRFKALLRQYVKGMKVFRVHPSDLARIEISLPDLHTQQKIVSFVDSMRYQELVLVKLNDYLAEIGEALVANLEANTALGDVCGFVGNKRNIDSIQIDEYVSTESLLQNRRGRQRASSIPESGKVTSFEIGDVLISNIRPYFQKIWRASFHGGCSNDVLVFRSNDTSYASCLYFVLRRSEFFDFVMRGAKGTKMPRGDKKRMLGYLVPGSIDGNSAMLLNYIVEQMSFNSIESERLVELKDALLPKLMSGEIDVSQVDLTPLNNHLAA